MIFLTPPSLLAVLMTCRIWYNMVIFGVNRYGEIGYGQKHGSYRTFSGVLVQGAKSYFTK